MGKSTQLHLMMSIAFDVLNTSLVEVIYKSDIASSLQLQVRDHNYKIKTIKIQLHTNIARAK